LRHHLSVNDIVLALNQSADPKSYLFINGIGIVTNNYGLQQSENLFTNPANNILTDMYKFKFTILFIFIRSGIYNILLLFLCYFALLKRRFAVNIVSVPVLSNTVSLLPIIGNQDHRYTYAAVLAFPLIFLFYLISAKDAVLINARTGGKSTVL